MSAEAMNPAEATTEERNRRLGREVNEMISALTSRLASLHRSQKPGGSSQVHEEDERRVSILTLAGNNTGATMRSGFDEKGASQQWALPPPSEPEAIASPQWAALVNSNLQAVNNSIMLETKYKSNDPGVHMDVAEALEPKGHKNPTHGGWKRKGKKKERSTSSSDSDTHSAESSVHV